MAGQTIVNYDGLSADAAEKLSMALVEGARNRIRETFQQATELGRTETLNPSVIRLLPEILRPMAEGGGGCGIGCC